MLPGGTSANPIPLRGPTNRFRDIAEDLQYQFIGDEHLFSVLATRIHESMTLDASVASGASANRSDDLTTTRVAGTYYFKRKIGGTVGYFSTTGTSDAGLYPGPASTPTAGPVAVITSANNSPETRGYTVELNYLPWLNTKVGVQYTAYTKFNGGGTNYDGAGRSASDNNTWYFLLWFAY